MNEIDLYSAYRLPTTTKQKDKKPRRGGHKFFIFLILLMCLVIIFFIANAFSNILTFSNVTILKDSPIVAKGFNAYSVQISDFENEQSAKRFAEEVQVSGAGGYVLYNVNYNVVLSVYLSSSDAQNVLEKVLPTYSNAELKVIEIKKCQLNGLSDKEDNVAVQNALNCFKSVYESLYTTSVNLDTSKITSQEAKVSLTTLLNEVGNVVSAFRDVCSEHKEDTKYSLTLAKVDQVVNLLNTLVESALTSTRLSSLIKYTQISSLLLQNELALLLD